VVARKAGEGALDDAVVVARPARHPTVAERLGRVAVVPREGGVTDLVRDLVAEPGDDGVPALELVELLEGELRPASVGDVPERLPETGEVLMALGRQPLVRDERSGDGRAGRPGGTRHGGSHLADRACGELPAEAGHPVAAAAHLAEHRRVIRPELVEVWADLPVRVGLSQRVTAGAAR